jgi:hypothetical protein
MKAKPPGGEPGGGANLTTRRQLNPTPPYSQARLIDDPEVVELRRAVWRLLLGMAVGAACGSALALLGCFWAWAL